MTKRTLFAAALSGSMLLGCAYPWPGVRTQADCHGQQCGAAITVSRHDTPDFRCFVENATPEELHVKHARPVLVSFEIEPRSASDGYRFPADGSGIVFPDPGFECKTLPGETRIECMNKAGPGEHKYTVNAVKGSTVCEPREQYGHWKSENS